MATITGRSNTGLLGAMRTSGLSDMGYSLSWLCQSSTTRLSVDAHAPLPARPLVSGAGLAAVTPSVTPMSYSRIRSCLL